VFKQIISRWGLDQYFKFNETDLRITCVNRNIILFRGLDDVEKLKSITFPKGELTDIWVEEATEVQEKDLDQLNLRLRGGKMPKQIVISFNPINVNHWLKRRFFDDRPTNCTVLHTTYHDNRFLEAEYIAELEKYKTIDPYYHTVYALGQWGVCGNTVFNANAIAYRIDTIKNKTPLKRGYFVYTDTGASLTDINFVDNESGAIVIYEQPKKGYPYVIGGDTAGEGSDKFAGQVLDNTTGKQVAVLHHQYDEDMYAKQVYCLGMHYNTALIAIEANFSTFPIKTLERLTYPNQYVREGEDEYTHKPKQSFGFKTTQVTRPVIIAGLIQVVRDSIDLINDAKTLDEMLTFVRNEKGRAEAQAGAHDDLVISLAIAHYIRPQQTYVAVKSVEDRVLWHKSQWDDYRRGNAAERAYMKKIWGEPIDHRYAERRE